MARRASAAGEKSAKKAAKSAKKGRRASASDQKKDGRTKGKSKSDSSDSKKAKKATKAAKGRKIDKAAKGKAKAKKSKKGKKKRRRNQGDPLLFAALSEGERADALRILTQDRRLAGMAAVGRYRVIAVEPLVVKDPHERCEHRLARVVAYDYAADRSVHAAVDLDDVCVAHLQLGPIQPMLAREEEAAAVEIALGDQDVKGKLGLGDRPQAALHYWSNREADIAYRRRSAAVLFGQPASRPSLVAVVDLLDNQVVEVVPADQW